MDLEIDHLNGLHESQSHHDCEICQRDATIAYQAQIIDQVEEVQFRLLKDLDILLKSVKAFHVNVADNGTLIPFGNSTKWVPVDIEVKPHQCEKVDILIKVDVDIDQHFKATGYLHRDKWYGWESREVVENVVAWRKLFGQVETKKFGSKKRNYTP